MVYEHQKAQWSKKEGNEKNNEKGKGKLHFKADLIDPKRHTSISLNDLIKWYLNINNVVKGEVRPLMQKDIYFWLKVSIVITKRDL